MTHERLAQLPRSSEVPAACPERYSFRTNASTATTSPASANSGTADAVSSTFRGASNAGNVGRMMVSALMTGNHLHALPDGFGDGMIGCAKAQQTSRTVINTALRVPRSSASEPPFMTGASPAPVYQSQNWFPCEFVQDACRDVEAVAVQRVAERFQCLV